MVLVVIMTVIRQMVRRFVIQIGLGITVLVIVRNKTVLLATISVTKAQALRFVIHSGTELIAKPTAKKETI